MFSHIPFCRNIRQSHHLRARCWITRPLPVNSESEMDTPDKPCSQITGHLAQLVSSTIFLGTSRQAQIKLGNSSVVKYLLAEHENLSSNPRTHLQSWCFEVETRGLTRGIYWPANLKLTSSKFSRRPCLKEKKCLQSVTQTNRNSCTETESYISPPPLNKKDHTKQTELVLYESHVVKTVMWSSHHTAGMSENVNIKLRTL